MDELQEYMGIHINHSYLCRVRGQDDGGWNGDKGWQGGIKFHGEVKDGKVVPTHLESTIPHLMDVFKIRSITFPERAEGQKEMTVRLETADGDDPCHTFQFNRAAVPNLVSFVRNSLGELEPKSALIESATTREKAAPLFISPLDALRSASTDEAEASPAQGVSKYASAEGNKLEEEARIVDYAPSVDDQKLITFWEQMLGRGDVVFDPIIARTAAVALIRSAMREPGRIIPLASVWGANRLSVHKTIQSILACSGLWRFAKNDEYTICFVKPEDQDDAYDWGRLCEQWLAPVEELKIEVHALPESSVTNIPGDKATSEAMMEALKMCQRLDDVAPLAHHPATPRNPKVR